jgi:3-deoxy-manno-octulosonate cytidylyltransferase (CMP-KDO synthetase)
MVWRVVERARLAEPRVAGVAVAAGDEEVRAAVVSRGGAAWLVGEACASGTERVARLIEREGEALRARFPRWDGRWVLNVQGDEPLLPPGSIAALCESLSECEARGERFATLACELSPLERAVRSRVKVCVNARGEALYFSREPIGGAQALLHIGVYALRVDALSLVYGRSALSLAEDLEQLSWLEAGERVRVVRVAAHPAAVDTPEDLERARSAWGET